MILITPVFECRKIDFAKIDFAKIDFAKIDFVKSIFAETVDGGKRSVCKSNTRFADRSEVMNAEYHTESDTRRKRKAVNLW